MLRVYEKDLTATGLQAALATGGLGCLTWVQEATVHRVINGDWSLTLTYPLDAPGADLLQSERLICYEDETGDAQLYRISRRKPRTTRQGRVIEIEAPHLCYDLSHRYITNIETTEDDRYPDGIDAKAALTQLLEGTGFQVGDVTVDETTLDYLDILQQDVMTCLKEQLLDKWGGELAFDNFTIHLKASLGEDRRYPIRDGRNIEEITVTENWEPVVTRLHVRGYDNANFEDINDGKDWIDSELIDQYSHVREGYADFSDVDDPEELMRLGREELSKKELPEITYDIRLAQLRGSVQYAAYKRLEALHLGDTAMLRTSALPKEVILRCQELETDCLTGRVITLKLGNTNVALLASMTAGVTANDRLSRVLDNKGLVQAEKIEGKLNLVRITNLTAEMARIAQAEVGKASIGEAQIVDASITRAKIAALAVDSAKIADAAITAAKIADASITTAKIENAAIHTAQIALGAITAALIEQGAIGEAQIADASITSAKIVELNADLIKSGTLATERLLLTGPDGVIYEINATAAGLTAEELTDAQYQQKLNGTVLVAKSVTAEQIAAGTITANEILAGTITGAEIAAETIEGSNIKAGTLTTSHVTADFGETLTLTSNEAILAKASQETVDEMGQRVAAAQGRLAATTEGVELLSARQDATENKQAQLALSVDGLSLRFTSQEARADSLEGSLDAVRANLDSYFTFSPEGYLEVGKDGMKSRFAADRLGFWDGVEEVAYVGNREFNSARIRAREFFFLGSLQMQVLADGKIRAAVAE